MEQVKVIFESDDGTEGLCATPTDAGFVLDNYPFYLKGVCFGDLVEAAPLAPGVYRYVKTLTKSANSLYRVFFEDTHSGRAAQLLESLRGLGCSHERGELDGAVLVAVNIPAVVDADAAWQILETGLNEGTWEIQEGTIGIRAMTIVSNNRWRIASLCVDRGWRRSCG
jgi:Domain of unknown function (DUF4265)